MTLSDWASIAEIVGACAIVVSLVFVGLQIRQEAEETALNTRAIAVGAFQDLTEQISRLNSLIVENPRLAELIQRLETGQNFGHDSIEKIQLRSYLIIVFRHGELAYRQYRNDLIDKSSLNSMLVPLRRFLGIEFGRELWEFVPLDSQYKDYVNRWIAPEDIDAIGSDSSV